MGSGRIAFHSDESGNFDIWSMRDDGTERVQLTDDPERDIEPDWSPDGKRIIFSSGRDDPENVQLYVMNADGSDESPLLPVAAFDNLSPRWSPDGERIAFYTNREGNFDVYVVDADGDNLTALTTDPGDDQTPGWSPDGSHIAFSSTRDGEAHIWIMDADGSNPRQVTKGDGADFRPEWSPDGKTLLFVSGRLGRPGLWRVPADGSAEPVSISDNPAVGNKDPRWVSDELVLFSSDRMRGLWQIWAMTPDGQDVTSLTVGGHSEGSPAWTPAQ